MLVIVVEDLVVPGVPTLVMLDCDAMPNDRLADLLLVRVKPQLMVILDDISKAVRQYRGKARKDISGGGLSTVLEILTTLSPGMASG